MSATEADKLVTYDEWMKTTGIPEVMGPLITLRIKTAKVSEAEGLLIHNLPWGETVFDAALLKNGGERTWLDAQHEAGIIEGATYSALRRADRKTLIRIMVAVMGGVALTASSFGVGAPLAVAGVGAIGGSVAMGRS
jgi:hypothetical protein